MPIETACPHCHTAYVLADSQAGKKVRCKTCQDAFDVQPLERDRPAAKAAPVRPVRADPDEEDQRPAQRRGRDEDEDDPDRPPRRLRRDEEDEDRPRRRSRDEEEEDRPRRRRRERDEWPKRRRSGGGIPLWVWLLVGGGSAALVGGIIIVFIVLYLSNPVTLANYNKLQTGMTEEEVIAIMGKPHVDSGKAFQEMGNMMGVQAGNALGMKQLVWRRGDDMISVSFMGGKVAIKSGKIGNKMMVGEGILDMGKLGEEMKKAFGR